MRLTPWVAWLWAGTLVCWCGASQAELFLARDHNPLVLAQGVPPLIPNTVSTADGWTAGLAYSRSNTFNEQSAAREHLLVDLESTVVDVWLGRRVTADTSFWMHAPLIAHTAGRLDGFIERYHAALSLPEGERVTFPRNAIHVRYERDGKRLLALEREVCGLGDVGFGVARSWARSEEVRGMTAAILKLPTGDAARLTGSGAAAAGLSADTTWRVRPVWSVMGRLGVQWLGAGEVLPDQQRRWAAHGAAALEWQTTPALALRAQIDLHSGLYRDARVRLLREALTLTMGGSLRLDGNLALDVAVVEDAHVEAAPDVTFHVALRGTF